MSIFFPTSDEEVAEYVSMKRFDDATEDRFSASVEPSRVCRRTSSDLFSGFSSFGSDIDAPFGSLRGSFSFGASDSPWGAVQPEQPAPASQDQPQRAGSLRRPGFLQRNDSIASNFTSMTDDELSDEVAPWSMATDSRFDFGFSSALRESCVYNVPREYLPSAEDSDAGDESESDTVIETDDSEEVDYDGDDVSDTATVCADEPEPSSPVEQVHDLETPQSPITESGLEFSISFWLPDAVMVAGLLADSPRRSTRVCRPSRAKLESVEQPQTPTKRKRPAPNGPNQSPSKKARFADNAKKPVSRSPKKAANREAPAGKKGKAAKRRVILRV
ncbi:hypothetical protein MSAN_00415000 [Mycena sanguinolenta]|uniref:Uncharacterized protein n=1 Tax=Mycena sanguinolenta TaxID=230812 RepID=A0A8H7DJ83_9AGAR|nr:hypothetical protein MSAN_00415000 [Mycena sanguinolenta]